MILAHYTGPFTNRTPKKRKITKKSKTPIHLPQSLQRSVRHCRRSRFPIVVGHQSQSPQGGGRRGGLTSGPNQPSTLPPKRIGQLPYPRRILRFHRRQPEQSSYFHQRSFSSRLTGSTTSSTDEDDDAPALDSWTGLPSLSVDVGVDRNRRTEEAGRNYSTAPPSLPHVTP